MFLAARTTKRPRRWYLDSALRLFAQAEVAARSGGIVGVEKGIAHVRDFRPCDKHGKSGGRRQVGGGFERVTVTGPGEAVTIGAESSGFEHGVRFRGQGPRFSR